MNDPSKAEFLAERMKLLEAAFHNLPNPVLIVNRAGKIVVFNKAYEDHLGISSNQALGQHVTKIIPNTKLLEVMKTRHDEILSHHEFPGGRVSIGNRVPIIDGEEVIGCIGFIYFENTKILKDTAALYEQLEKQVETYKGVMENRAFSQNTIDHVLSTGSKMAQCKEATLRVARLDMPLLITGENGVGKELIVHAVHSASSRKYGPLIKVNCTAIPRDLFEAEFFGYAKGAFSGAKKEGKKGFFELAESGTIFLDEVANIPIEAQTKLLRVVQEREFYRVGGEEPIHTNARVIAATNRNLKIMVETGEFREDLYYRLNAISLEVPPLRERKEDIELLAKHFLSEFSREYGTPVKHLSVQAAEVLGSYHWPGNIRELRNVMTKLSVFCQHKTIESEDVLAILPVDKALSSGGAKESLEDFIKKAERDYILQTLKSCSGNKSRAARMLGIDRSLLYKKLRRLA